MIMTALMIRITCVCACMCVKEMRLKNRAKSKKEEEKEKKKITNEWTDQHGNQCNMFQYNLKQNSVKL